MSHITTIETDIKITDETQFVNALNALRRRFPGLTYQKSEDGKIVQVKYDKIDVPVAHYHPEGNLRFNKKNDESWEMSGDAWNCRDRVTGKNLYTEVTDAFLMEYQKCGSMQFFNMEGYTVSESKDEQGNIVLLARKW